MGIYENNIIPWLLDVTEPPEMAEQRLMLLHDVSPEDIIDHSNPELIN